jgi:uncharacterized protein YaiE (UPF0345 family)
MNEHTLTTPTTASERMYCPACGSEMLLDTQPDYREGHEGESFTIATCPNSPRNCKVGQATTTIRRLENGEFFQQWSAVARYDLHSGKAVA